MRVHAKAALAAMLLALGLALLTRSVEAQACDNPEKALERPDITSAAPNALSLYAANLTVVDIQGKELHTADLAGKVTLIVNVASQCGYTDANYRGIQEVYERYREYNFEVLAFPCNQFGQQEPGSHAEIQAFVDENYPAAAQLPLMAKIEVNGPGQHPIYAWLQAHAPAAPGQQRGADIVWNFEKFLIDKAGLPVKRYTSDFDQSGVAWDVYNELIKTPGGQQAAA